MSEMHSASSKATGTSLTLSPPDVEFLNEAVLYSATQDGLVSVLQSLDLQCDWTSPVGKGTFSTCVKALKGGPSSVWLKYRGLSIMTTLTGS